MFQACIIDFNKDQLLKKHQSHQERILQNLEGIQAHLHSKDRLIRSLSKYHRGIRISQEIRTVFRITLQDRCLQRYRCKYHTRFQRTEDINYMRILIMTLKAIKMQIIERQSKLKEASVIVRKFQCKIYYL